jgi:hypothetical protein
MRIVGGGRDFSTWFARVKEEGGRALELTAALLAVLRDLAARPSEDTATLKRVCQARRHEIWRPAHPFEPGLAVRSSAGSRTTRRLSWRSSAERRLASVTSGTTRPPREPRQWWIST